MKRTDFKALTFGGHGRFIDRHARMVEGLRSQVSKMGRAASRSEILKAHARHKIAQQLPMPGKAGRDLLPVASSMAHFAKAHQDQLRA